MASLPKFCLSIITLIGLVSVYIWNTDSLSNETYTHLDPNERRKLSSEYVALGKTRGNGHPESMKLLEKAARINPQNELAWLALSYPYLYAGLYEEWHNHITKAVNLNPKEWQGLRGLQKIFYFRDYGGALYDLDATDTLTIGKTDYANSYSVHYLRGLAYLGLKNYSMSKQFFSDYLAEEAAKTGTKFTDYSAYIYLGIIENQNQNYKEAILQLQPALEEATILADAHFHTAYAQFMLGNIEKASHHIALASEKFEKGEYHKARRFESYEVLHQLYKNQIKQLRQDIACFQ